jgi:hypothetical protein
MRLISLSLLYACGTESPETETPVTDPAHMEQMLASINPESLALLVDETESWIPADANCPLVQTLQEEGTNRHVWQGDCVQSDGTLVMGRLELYEAQETTWVVGEGFGIRRDQQLELWLDGAIELVDQDELLLLDVAASVCGINGAECVDGTMVLDLAYTIYPAAGYPTQFDATVSGAIGRDDVLIEVEGTWSMDLDRCTQEPTTGLFAFQQAERHTVAFDGASDCDACAAWQVQGVAVTPYCPSGR